MTTFTRYEGDVPEFIPAKRKYLPRTMGNKSGPRVHMDREFIGWDGEGWTKHVCSDSEECTNLDGACKHYYFLFGSSAGPERSGRNLSTAQCLDVMLQCAAENPSAIHVGFAFGYDSNMILGDLQPKHMFLLRMNKSVTWQGYRIEYIPKKWFQVSGYVNGKKVTCRIQDIFSFYGTSFLKALKQYKVGTEAEWKTIEAGKDARNTFTLEQGDSLVRPYWKLELRLLVDLADALRDILHSGGYDIAQWFGPGAIASYTYKQRGQERNMSRDLPDQIIDASTRAYAGGRFEQFRGGLYEGTVYSADINSAYPYAMSLLPNLATGRWEHSRDPGYLREIGSRETVPGRTIRLGLFHVRYEVSERTRMNANTFGLPLPTFHRDNGGIIFPTKVDNWVHLPEFQLLVALSETEGEDAFFKSFEIIDGHVFHDDGTNPYAWVAELYTQRKVWKAQGNPAQLAAKLGLNSLYGKLAQRVGGRDGRIPTWHQLEYAGAITSKCRAMLYEASVQDYRGLIGYETDGVYSTQLLSGLSSPDSTGTGDGLGQWETGVYTGILYVQSGVYWLRDSEGQWQPPKSRGIPQRHLEFDKAVEALARREPIRAQQTQFVGMGQAAMSKKDIWRTWRKVDKEIAFGGNGKRVHHRLICRACHMGTGYTEGLHTLFPTPRWVAGPSDPHPLPWREKANKPTRKHRLNQAAQGELW